ncbi:MAG: hypothetical protein AAGI30_07820 [Planctomycetota bacterium]
MIRIKTVSPLRAAIACLGSVAMLQSLAAAQADVYEPFNIVFNTPVGPGGSSGFGWGADWTAALDTTTPGIVGPRARGPAGSWGPDQDGMNDDDNLDFAGYTTGGNTAGFSAQRTAGAGVSTIARPFNAGVLDAGLIQGGEIWFSMLIQAPSFNAQYGAGLGNTAFDPDRGSAPPQTANNDRLHGFRFRDPGGGGPETSVMELVSQSWWGSTGSANGFLAGGDTAIAVEFDEEMLVIVRYQFVAGLEDIVTVYKVTETDTGASLDSLPSSSHFAFLDPSTLTQLSIYDQLNFRQDEIRIAALAPGGDPQSSLDAVAPGMQLSFAADSGVYEPFELSFNTVIGPGGSTGNGWADDWTVTRSSAALSANNNLVSRFINQSFGPDQDGIDQDNIPFDGYTTGGFTQGFSVLRQPNAMGQSAASRPFLAASLQSGLQQGGEVWGSLLIQAQTTFNSNYYFGLAAQPFDAETQAPIVTTEDDKTIGFRIQAGGGTMVLKAQAWRGNNGSGQAGFTTGGPDIPVAQGERMLIVMRYQFENGSNDSVTIWKVNDTDNGRFLSEIATEGRESAINGLFIDEATISLVAQVESGNPIWDEVRFVPVAPATGRAGVEAALDAVAPGMNLDLAPLPVLSFVDDDADLYEPFDMPGGELIDQQGSGKGWGETGTDASTASRWQSQATSQGGTPGQHEVLPAPQSFGDIDLFGSPELVINGNSAQRVPDSGASSISREIDPDLAAVLFQEGGETWISAIFDLNDRSAGIVPILAAPSAVVFSNIQYGPEGFGEFPEGTPGVFGESSGFGIRFTGNSAGSDTIIRPWVYLDGWSETIACFLSGENPCPNGAADIPQDTNWFPGDRIMVVMRVQWSGDGDGVPVDGNSDMIPDAGTADVLTLWRLVPEFSIGDAGTNLDTFPGVEHVQGEDFFTPPNMDFPYGEVEIRNQLINTVSIAQNEAQAIDELRVSYVRPGETSQDALSRVSPGLSLTVSNTASPPCNVFDLDGDGDNDGDDVALFIADTSNDAFAIGVYLNNTAAIDPNCGE